MLKQPGAPAQPARCVTAWFSLQGEDLDRLDNGFPSD
jgi:hypothetical protein